MNNETQASPYRGAHKQKQKRPSWGSPIIYIAAIVLVLFMLRLQKPAQEQLGISSVMAIILMWAMMVIFYLVGIMFHSVGRLVMGLLSGYKILLFSAGPFAFVRENGRLVRKSLPSQFWLGQCLMAPKQEERPEDVHCFWYYFGGAFFDILLLVVSGAVIVLSHNPVVRWGMSTLTIAAGTLVMIYLIPNDSGVPNDGMTLLRVIKGPKARRAEKSILMLTGMEYDGTRAADIPQELFEGADENGVSPLCNLAFIKASCLEAKGDYAAEKRAHKGFWAAALKKTKKSLDKAIF